MSRTLRRAVTWSGLGAVAAVIAAIVRPDDRALVLDAYLLFVGGIALLLLVRVTGGALPAAGESRFERARFSDHEIDAAMKDEAIDALVSVRDDLRAS